jgi:hypothetical protein
MNKQWFKSRGVWLGIITASIGTLQLVSELLASGTFSMEGLALAGVGVLKIWERFTREVQL